MAVFVDDYYAPYRGMLMCHMMADSLSELHEMADRLSLKRSWFQEHSRYPHYDICKAKRGKAVSLGAIEISAKELILRFKP